MIFLMRFFPGEDCNLLAARLFPRIWHVGLSWIISSSKQMKYDIKENNHPDWLHKGPRYNTAKLFGLNYFITKMKFKKKGS